MGGATIVDFAIGIGLVALLVYVIFALLLSDCSDDPPSSIRAFGRTYKLDGTFSCASSKKSGRRAREACSAKSVEGG